MANEFEIAAIERIDDDLLALVAVARGEGFTFMDRLVNHWSSGENRFDQPGECYFAVRLGGRLVAAGGLNRDPYCETAGVGRVRHVYVLPEARRSGAGTELLAAIIVAARSQFQLLRLRTTTERGAAFYEALGFERSDAPDASHMMRI
ncbi:MAG: GNAT family N-acetyltransferase [Novosphingobium sp.]